MAFEDLEQLRVELGLLLDCFGGDRLGAETAPAEASPTKTVTGRKRPAVAPDDRDVQLADGDLQPERLVVDDCLFDIVEVRTGGPMPLDTHAVDRRSLFDQALEQYHGTRVLAGVPCNAALDAVVVVVEFGVRICFMCPLERHRENVGSDGPVPTVVSQILRPACAAVVII